jgi:hypothetical protein
MLFCVISTSLSQEISTQDVSGEEVESVQIETDGEQKSFNRFEITFDYLKLLTFAFPEETKLEAGIGFISKINIGVNVEVGYGEKKPEDFYKNADYKVYGYYGRAGLSYYYPFKAGTNFIIGVKYAMSQYQDEAAFSILSSLWDDYEDYFERTDLEASWVELIIGSESSVAGNLYFGFTFRMRFLIEADNFSTFEVYSVPGYGRTFDNFVPALNLYIKYYIPFGIGK